MPDDTNPNGAGENLGGKTFTQEDVNRILAEEKRKSQKKNEELVGQLKKYQETHSLTAQQKEELENQIATLQNEYMSKEELSKKELTKLQKDLENTQKSLSGERDHWKNLFTKTTIENEIIHHGAKNEAFNPKILVSVLGQFTSIIEEKSSGGTSYKTTVNLPDIDKEGNPTTSQLSVEDAVKRMRELPDYSSLFKSKATGGVGGTNESVGGKAPDPAKMSFDEYMAWRKKNNPGG